MRGGQLHKAKGIRSTCNDNAGQEQASPVHLLEALLDMPPLPMLLHNPITWVLGKSNLNTAEADHVLRMVSLNPQLQAHDRDVARLPCHCVLCSVAGESWFMCALQLPVAAQGSGVLPANQPQCPEHHGPRPREGPHPSHCS
jgi:hypothetical protein